MNSYVSELLTGRAEIMRPGLQEPKIEHLNNNLSIKILAKILSKKIITLTSFNGLEGADTLFTGGLACLK